MTKSVSLGLNCEAAYQFRRVRKSDDASFFNWTWCTLPSLISVIRSDFSGLLEEQNLSPTGVMIFDKSHRLAFHGDVFNKSNGGKDEVKKHEHLEALRSKTAHLIDKWRQTTSSAEPVNYYLKIAKNSLRGGMTLTSGVRELHDLMVNKYPYHNFNIIVLQADNEIISTDELNYDRIIYRRLETYDPQGRPAYGHVPSWDRIFSEFPVS